MASESFSGTPTEQWQHKPASYVSPELQAHLNDAGGQEQTKQAANSPVVQAVQAPQSPPPSPSKAVGAGTIRQASNPVPPSPPSRKRTLDKRTKRMSAMMTGDYLTVLEGHEDDSLSDVSAADVDLDGYGGEPQFIIGSNTRMSQVSEKLGNHRRASIFS